MHPGHHHQNRTEPGTRVSHSSLLSTFRVQLSSARASFAPAPQTVRLSGFRLVSHPTQLIGDHEPWRPEP